MIGVFAGAERDADAASAAGIGGAVTDEDAAGAHAVGKCCCIGCSLGDTEENEVGLARPELQSEGRKRVFEAGARVANLGNIVVNISLIGDRFRKAGEGDGIYVVGRRGAAKGGHLIGRADECADAKSGETVGLGEGARNKEVRRFAAAPEKSLAAELEVGFVNKDGGVRCGLRDGEKVIGWGE